VVVSNGLLPEPEREPVDCLMFERMFWTRGLEYVAGVDEAGRGCLAGPVVACAVILPKGEIIPGIADSKSLSPKRREELAREIKMRAISWSIGVTGPQEIDEINILQASLKAMRMAVEELDPKPAAILVDGNQPLQCDILLKTVPKGDRLSHTISAASIIAKVYRDALMVEYHEKYPSYNFFKNKGYPTREHKEALARMGPCPIHRRSFKGV